MSENGFPNSSVPSSNPFLSRQNSVFVFPFSVPGITPETSLNHIQSLSEIEPIPQIKQVRNAQNILIIEKQSSLKINRTYNTSTKDSVKIGQLLHENLILKSNNSELLTNFENLKEELLKLTQNLFELKKEKENNEHKIRVYQKNNSELSISLCNSKKNEQEMKEKVSILIDENLKIIQFNQELQEIIRGNVSQEALRLKEENQVLKDCNKRLEESCKSVKTSQNFDQVLEKKQFNMELENYLKELQDENMRLKNTLFEVLNS